MNEIATASALIVIVWGFSAITTEVAVAADPTVVVIDHNPQFFVDDTLVDNRWGVQYLTETVTRVSHQPRKDTHNPVIVGNGGYGEQIELSRLGNLAVRRASHVEPNEDGRWLANLSPVDGPTLGPYDKRSVALHEEEQWLQANWLIVH